MARRMPQPKAPGFSADKLLTQSAQRGKLVDMETIVQKPVVVGSDDAKKNRQYRDLPAKPIVVYPTSEEQRKLFEEAAARDNRKLSPFVLNVLTKYLEDEAEEERRRRRRTA